MQSLSEIIALIEQDAAENNPLVSSMIKEILTFCGLIDLKDWT